MPSSSRPYRSASQKGSSRFGSDAGLAAHRMGALGLRSARSATPAGVARHLVALQSQEHTLARWSVAQRLDHPVRAAQIDEAFDRGELVRTHVLRPTWHYVSAQDLRWLVRFSGPRVAARNARYWRQFGLDARRLAASTDKIARAVEEGPCTRAELGARLGRRRDPLTPAEVAPLVMHAELHMAVCSGPMRDKQHTYVAFDSRARGDGPAGQEALALLARRYFTSRGPATVRDFAWWAGLPVAEARRGLNMAADDLEFHDADGRRYAFAPGTWPDEPAIDLLQCYDEAIISYTESRDVLQTARVSFPPLRLVDGFRHVILRGGQLLGHWRLVRSEDRIEVRLADAVSREEEEVLEARTRELRQFLLG